MKEDIKIEIIIEMNNPKQSEDLRDYLIEGLNKELQRLSRLETRPGYLDIFGFHIKKEIKQKTKKPCFHKIT